MADAPVKPKPKRNLKLWLGVALILAIYALYCWPWFPPRKLPSGHYPPQFTLGRETTYYTDPLDEEGFPDYEEALNLLMAQGIDPEQNAVAILQQALGPTPVGQPVPAQFYEWLKVEPPLKEGSYFVRYGDWIKEKDPEGNRERVGSSLSPERLPVAVMQQPWRGEDHPLVAEWLAINERSLAIFVEASKKPQFFHPMVNPHKGEPQGTLLETMVPTLVLVRQQFEALLGRAMLQVNLGNYEEARKDLLACHRWARLMQLRPSTLEQHSLGSSLERTALFADLIVLERGDFSRETLESWQKDWAHQPSLLPIVESFDQVERALPLQLITFVNKFGLDALAAAIRGWQMDDFKAYQEFSSRFYLMHFDRVLLTVNSGLDRLTAAGRMTDRGERNRAIVEMEMELEAAREHDQLLLQQVRVGILPRYYQGEAYAEMLGRFFLKHMASSLWMAKQSEDQTDEANRLFAIALSLAIHRKVKGTYPADLGELVPALSPMVLEDICSGKPHIYRKTAEGYLLYSVGPNREDDDGSTMEDRLGGDDMKVEMPTPQIRKK